jgi:transcriptional regulator with XRE-family HTH domain
VARVRAGSSRPIPPGDVPALEALGRELYGLRRLYGLERAPVADLALVSRNHLWRIEMALRRTRASTVVRLVGAIGVLMDPADAVFFDGEAEAARLLEVAGSALAPEPLKAERSLRRAEARRVRRRERGGRL